MNNIQDCYGVNKDGHFTLGGADTVALAKKYGTPLYLLDENKIRRQCEIYREAIKKHFPEGSMPFYASKALSFVDIYKIVKSENIGIDIVSRVSFIQLSPQALMFQTLASTETTRRMMILNTE